MKKDQHTQGPWIKINGELKGANGRLVSVSNLGMTICMAGHTDETRANARLISAAPELLAALEHLLNGSISLPRFAEEQARAAIAKARGDA